MADFQNDTFNALKNGLAIGQAVRGVQDRNKLNSLASQAYGVMPDNRNQILSQMAAIDPASAQSQEKAFAYSDERRNANLVNMAKLLTSAPEQARPGLWQKFLPTLSQFGLSDLPQQYDAQTAPLINQTAQSLVQAYSGGAGGNVQSTYVNDQGQRVAIMRDGSTQILGGNDAGANQQTLTIDVNGTPTQVTFDRRTGRYSNASLGAPVQQIQQVNGQPTYIDPSLPPEVQAALRSGAGDGLQDGGQLQVQQPVAQPLVGRRAEDQAAAVESAKLGVQQQYLPQELAARSQSAIQQAVGTERAKAEVGREQDAIADYPRANQEANQTISLIDSALAHPGLETATGLSGRIDPRNLIPGTDAANFQALLDQIKGKTFLQAFQSLKGGGAITEVEGRKAEEAIARLNTNQSSDAFRQSLRELRGIANSAKQRAEKKYIQATGSAPNSQQSAPLQIQSAAEYNALPSGTLFIAPDGTQRRKR